MLANPSDFREVDFSHLTFVVADLEVSSRARPSSSYLIGGLFLSVILHALLLLWQSNLSPALAPIIDRPPEIHLTLHHALIKPQEVSGPPNQHENLINSDSVISEPVAPELKAAPDLPDPVIANPPVVQKPRIITSLSRDEMHEIYIQRKTTIAPQNADSISRNVFHPGLRERLMIEESKPDLQRVADGLSAHLDPSGATRVNLGDDECLRSSGGHSMGGAQNWYMTACGGKSESEKIMERVNRSVNEKSKFNN
jgi:hypothetical protein